MSNIERTSDFIQSIGVNAHIDETGSSYASSNVLAQMQYLGIDNMRTESPYDNVAAYTALGQAGIKFDLITSIDHATPLNLSNEMSYIDAVAPYVESVEGPNEINGDPVTYDGITDNVAAATAFQKDLYNAVHSDSKLQGVSVLPFSLSVGDPVTGYGNVTAYADEANIHGYAGGGVPPFWMLSYAVSSVTTVTGKPVVMSETGYYTANDDNAGVTQDLQAKWDMDTLLDNSLAGVSQTYLYELENNGTDVSNAQDDYGLFNNDGTAKQSAVDLHNLTSILADTGANAATFTPAAFNYTVSGLPANDGFSNVYAKSNGSFDVALWQEPDFFNESAGTENAVTPSSVTVALGGSYNVSVYDPVTGTTAISTYKDVTSVTVSLGTDPLIVEVSPLSATMTPTPVVTTPVVTTPVVTTPIVTTPVTTTPVVTAPTAIPSPVLGSGTESIVVNLSEDAYQGDAQAQIMVDGVQIGGTQTVTALQGQSATEAFTLLGNWAPGTNTVTVTFLNDLYAGTASTDRNLYFDSVTSSGTTTAVAAPLLSTGSTDTVTATVAAPPAVTIGSGGSEITVNLSEDAYQGDAQAKIMVDGVQVGGTQTVTALQDQGATEAFNLLGNWGAGTHSVTVTFLNDLYAGTPTTDRNLYFDSVSSNGTTTTVTAPLVSTGSTDTVNTTVAGPPSVTIGSGSGEITVNLSEDAWQGDAQAVITVDGVQIGGTQTVVASHAAGATEAFNLLGNFSAGPHTVNVSFINDAYGGTASTDRNLYVASVIAGGTTTTLNSALYSNGGTSFTAAVPPSVTVGSGSSVITVDLSEDAWQGNAQAQIEVDGVQVGSAQTVTALHGQGGTEAFNLLGNFAPGAHNVTVTFLNDAFGGTTSTDRNLYVDSTTAGGQSKAVAAPLLSTGSTTTVGVNVTAAVIEGTTPLTLAFIGASGAATIDGGSTAGTTLTAGTARTDFVLHAGTSNGDTIANFNTSLSAGDFLQLAGYGAGATLTQVSATSWQAASASGSVHDLLHLTNGAALVQGAVMFS